MTESIISLQIPHAAISFWSGLIRESANKNRIPEGVKSLIVAVFPYYCEEALGGNVAMFGSQQDYHRVIKELLTPDIERLRGEYSDHYFTLFVDDSPFNEVAAAQEAGLGVRGENNLLQHPQYGSFVYIATIATSLEPEELSAVRFVRRGCIACNRCIKACPGEALGEFFDRTRCASYISQKKGELSAEQAAILKKSASIYGCDICQRVCPANESPQRGMGCFCDDINPNYTTVGMARQLKGRTPEWRGEAIIRRNLSIIKKGG